MAFPLKRPLTFLLVVLAVAAAVAMFVSIRHSSQKPPDTPAAGKAEYTCPMHPFIVKDRPGVCPICNMELVAKTTGAVALDDFKLKEHVYLSPAQQVMANLEVVTVVYKPLFKIIEAAGVIGYDQTKQARISAWVAGRIDSLQANMVGMPVKKSSVLAELTSPDLVSAEEEYLGLMGTDQKERSRQLKDPTELLYWTRLKLIQLGFADAQFRELEITRRPSVHIPVYPPLNGIVTEKNVLAGQYVKAGDPLFIVSDLTTVWGELEVFEDEFPYLKIGQQVTLTSRSYPQREFAGKISYIYPFLNPKTRTNRIRVVVENTPLLLKPDMVVNATIQVPLGTDLTVPREAVVSSGDKNLVWARVKAGVFVPKEVTVGVRYLNDVQILSGLKKDDAVAASGAYLIDSEAQLKPGGARAGGSQDTTPPPVSVLRRGSQAHAVSVPKDAMDMSDMDMEADSASRSSQTPSRALRH